MAQYTISSEDTDYTKSVKDRAELSTTLWRMRLDAQRLARKELMSLPRNPPAVDVRSRRDPDAATSLRVGSQTTADVSSAILATNVVRKVPGT